MADTRGDSGRTGLHPARPRRHRSPRNAARCGAVLAGRPGDDVHEPSLDASSIRRVLHRRGVERLLPPGPGRRPDGPVRGLRPRHPSWLRQRPRPGGGRRGQGGRGDRLGRGHEDPLRRDPSRPDERLDDDERCRPADDGVLHRGRRGTGCRCRAAQRDHPERHPQGVHGPQHLHLSARAIHADRGRRDRVHGQEHAPLQLDLDLRLPHAGGGSDGGSGVGVHPGRRLGVRPGGGRPGSRHRRLRPAAELLLRHRHEPLHGGRQAAGRPAPVVQVDQLVGAEEAGIPHAPHPLPDVGGVAHGTGSLQQHRPHRLRGPGRRARWNPEPPHQLLRRGARTAHRLQRPDRPEHAADPGRGDRSSEGGRSARRELLRRAPHRRSGRSGRGAHLRGGADRRHDPGGVQRAAEAAHRGIRRPPTSPRRPG